MPHANGSSWSFENERSDIDILRQSLRDYAVILLDPGGRIVQWSEGAEKIFGYRESDALGRPFDLIFTPEDRAANVPAAQLTRAAHDDAAEDRRWHLRKDGARIWLSGMLRAIHNESGELTGYSEVAREITRYKQTELEREALLNRERTARIEAERKWKTLEEISENVPAMMALVRLPDQVYVFANRMFREAMGGREIISRAFRQEHPGAGTELLDCFDTVVATGTAWAATGRKVQLGGMGERYLDLILQPIRGNGGQLEAILIFATDVTDRARTRLDLERVAGDLSRTRVDNGLASRGRRGRVSEKLKAALHGLRELKADRERLAVEIAERRRAEELSEEKLALLDLAQDAIIALSLDDTVEVWNHGAETMYGWMKEEALGRNINELLRTAFPEQIRPAKDALLAAGQWRGELKHYCRDGRVIDVSSRRVLWRRDGAPRGWLEINRDITERKAVEARLRAAQKLESLGVLAGGIAHDFNNLLMGIMGNAGMALEMTESESRISHLLTRVLRAAEHAALLTGQMLAYAGKGQFVMRPVDLSSVLRETMPLLGSSIPENVDVELNLADPLPAIDADRAQMQQVAMNLILNAAEAIGNAAGNITVKTSAQVIDSGGIEPCCDAGRLTPGAYVVLEVQDTGSGIEPSTRPKIFDPFFTTKFMGRGLGLAAVSGIVRALDGAIQVDSAPGKGTAFRVFFPTGREEPPATTAVQEQKSRSLILVADDDEMVREAIEAMLRSNGYDVLAAASGKGAVDLFRQNREEIALVVLDMSMPVMGGAEALRELKTIRPETPVVVSSGYDAGEAARRFGGVAAGSVQKPYRFGALLRKIEEVLKQQPRAG